MTSYMTEPNHVITPPLPSSPSRAASAALVVASAIGVAMGTLLSEFISEKVLAYVAGTGFIAIGLVTLYQAATS